MKRKSYSHCRTFVTLLMIVALLFSLLPASAIALPEQAGSPPEISASDIPEPLSAEQLAQHGAVQRLRGEEPDEYTFVFLNNDGTRTSYSYGVPVKYTDENGTVRDKNNTVKDFNSEYGNTESDVQLRFPKKLNAVKISYKNHQVQIKPITDMAPGHIEAAVSGNTVTYANAFGEGMDLRYASTMNGVKEDIILQSNTGVTSFSFEVKTGGLALKELDGEWCVADGDRKIFGFGDLDVTDSFTGESEATDDWSAHSTTASISVETVQENKRYMVTLSVDEAFLNAPSTVYPVYVDPSFNVQSSYIQDTYISQGSPNTNYGTGKELKLGYGASSKSNRVLVKFSSIVNGVTQPGLDATTVVSAKYYMYCTTTYTSTPYVDAYMIPVSIADWTDTGATWNNAAANTLDTSFLNGSTQVGSAGWYNFDVTEAYKTWWRVYITRGLLFKMRIESATENYYRHFASANYTADSAKLPYLTVNYQTATNIMISPANMQISVGQTKQIVSTIYPNGQIINWSSSNANVADVNSSGLVTAKGAGSAVITARSQSNSAVYATCNVTVLPAVSSISLPQTVYVSKDDQYTLIPIIQPSNADKTLIWSSSNAEVATVSNGIVTAIGAGTATVTATAVNGKQASCTIIVPELKDGEYYILNSTKQLFITPQGQSQEAGTRQLLSSAVTDMKIQCYRFRLFSNGYYTIQNVKSGQYLGVDSTASGSDLKQYAIYDSDRHYFKLERNASGTYRIIPKANEGSGLALRWDYGLAGITNSVKLRAENADVNFDWVISETKYEVTIAPYFDHAFAQRYGNGNEFVAKGVLNGLFEDVSEFFKREFKVQLKVREAQKYISEPDKCKYGRNVPLLDDLPCPKNPGSGSQDHSCPNAETLMNTILNSTVGAAFRDVIGDCTSWGNLAVPFYIDAVLNNTLQNDKDIYILFTGHKLYNNSYNHEDNTDECNRSYSVEFIKCIVMQEIEDINEIKHVVEHEISHQFGAIDHYHEGPEKDADGNKIICKNAPYCSVCCDGGTQCRPLICKMCNSSIGMYCRECRQDIINYLGSHAGDYKFE